MHSMFPVAPPVVTIAPITHPSAASCPICVIHANSSPASRFGARQTLQGPTHRTALLVSRAHCLHPWHPFTNSGTGDVAESLTAAMLQRVSTIQSLTGQTGVHARGRCGENGMRTAPACLSPLGSTPPLLFNSSHSFPRVLHGQEDLPPGCFI